MLPFKIGVMSDSFRLPPLEGVRKAKEVGADGFQIYVVRGEMSPECMDAQARANFRKFCADLKLEISALCGDLGGKGFQLAEDNLVKVPRSKAIVDLAADLGTTVVTTHIGVVPHDRNSQTYQIMRAACSELGNYAASRGITFAIETGPEKATTLKAFLEDVGSEGMGVNLDPANLVMVVADDPVQAVFTLQDWIVHTHAKDGVQLKPCNPEEVYSGLAKKGIKGLESERGFKELPLGQGGVRWDDYLKALHAIQYKGFLTIEREVGKQPFDDISQAVNFLRVKLNIA